VERTRKPTSCWSTSTAISSCTMSVGRRCDLLEPDASRGAHPVLRRRGSGDAIPLPGGRGELSSLRSSLLRASLLHPAWSSPVFGVGRHRRVRRKCGGFPSIATIDG
jgi:hypothetical protein